MFESIEFSSPFFRFLLLVLFHVIYHHFLQTRALLLLLLLTHFLCSALATLLLFYYNGIQYGCGPVAMEGYLMKQTSSFQRWKRRFFRLRGDKLAYSKGPHVSVSSHLPRTVFPSLSSLSYPCERVQFSHQYTTPAGNWNTHEAAREKRNRDFFDGVWKFSASFPFYDKYRRASLALSLQLLHAKLTSVSNL